MITAEMHILCSSKRKGHWIYKFTDEFGLKEFRCTGCGKWAIKVPNIEFIVWRDRMTTKGERLRQIIEFLENNEDKILGMFPKEFLDFYMREGEEEYFKGQLQQMFRNLRRNCPWFFEDDDEE